MFDDEPDADDDEAAWDDGDEAEDLDDEDEYDDEEDDAPDCPDCGSEMVRKSSRYGDFWSCRRFPECRGARNIVSAPVENGDDAEDEAPPDCPDCGSGMIRRTAHRGPNAGNDFWGCSDYPECTGTRPIPSAPEDADDDTPDCPDCGSGMVRRTAHRGPNTGNDFWGCSNYPECRGTRDIEPAFKAEKDIEEAILDPSKDEDEITQEDYLEDDDPGQLIEDSLKEDYLDEDGAESPNNDHKTISETEYDESVAVEQLQASPLPSESIAQEKHVRIKHDQKEISFDRLLGPYLKGATRIKVNDPYILAVHQRINFMEFLATVVKHKDPETEVSVKLSTKKNETHGEHQQEDFQKMQVAFKALGVDFTWEFKDVHDRHIKIDKDWMITMGRGFDIFQRYEIEDALASAHFRQEIHRCKKCEVTFIRYHNIKDV